MIFKAGLIWAIGLVTFVPCGVYYLLFKAPRDQYALLIVSILFWIFGYWGVVGPILAALKVRCVFKSLEMAHAQGKLREALQSEETADVAIDFIATENKIPRFLAAKVYRLLLRKFSTGTAEQPKDKGLSANHANPRELKISGDSRNSRTDRL